MTILDVAKACNVSKSTVSLVMNNSDAVKEETREKVLEAVRRLGYVPNLAARELQTKRKNVIGLIFLTDSMFGKVNSFHSVTETLFYDTFNGISTYLNGTDYGLLSERFAAMDQTDDLPDLIRNNRVDGVIMIGGLFNQHFVKKIKERGLPTVMIGRMVRGIDSVAVNVSKAMYLGAKYLLEQGYRKMVLINGPQDMPATQKKLKGFKQALSELEIPIESQTILNANYTGIAGYQAMKQIWENGARPEAVFATNDGIAVGAMRYLYEQDVRIPEDLSIISYERSIISEHAIPALTTLDISKEKMGEEACKLLIRRITLPESKTVHLTLESSLIVRESVGERIMDDRAYTANS